MRTRRVTSRAKVQAHRERLRSQGLRPVQFWVPDTRSEAFHGEAARQSASVAESSHAAEDDAFIEAITAEA
jgi:hypothetical protein